VEVSPEWDKVIRSIAEHPGVTMVIGGVDVGKTAFSMELANAGVAAGIQTAIIDADIGQSEIGPPTAISMATLTQPVESLRDLRPRRIYFVGSTSPYGHILPTVIGVKRMVDEAANKGAKLIVVDTSGLVDGVIGRRLKLHKAELIAPKYVVGIQAKREIDSILKPLSKNDTYTLYRLEPSKEVRAKSGDFRTARRRTQFYEYFRNAERHIIRLDDITCFGTLFTTGKPVGWQHYRTLERALKAKILHAEVVGDGMYVVAECRPAMKGVTGLMEKYGRREFTVVCGTDFSNILVGLSDSKGNTLDLGIIESVDFGHRHMAVLSPVKSIVPVRLVQFGSLRVHQDGIEIGKIKPGEI
jgi:polynucleotide 5'-hydroxyl-kinase GRC3/NOL9